VTDNGDQRTETLARFSSLTGAPEIKRIVQRGRDTETARYTIELADGRAVRVGSIKVLTSQAELSRVLAVTCSVMPRRLKPTAWGDVLTTLISCAVDVQETPGEALEDRISDWLSLYASGAHTADRDGAAAAREPFISDEHLHIAASHFAKWIRREYGETMRTSDVYPALSDLGFTPQSIYYIRPRGKIRQHVRYYRAPLSVLDEAGEP